ncbi:MAG: [cytidine(C)-cytidine(C)-adenosine (A)]-adding enzyme [Myxococcales bacterium]|nr:[cytidine(C)-cytidine(C)-adenosine (A)]-adding enzyme [Myxococcales bacterium]
MTAVDRLSPPPPAAMTVLAALHGAGHEGWFVGGCVRDRLLGRAVNDWDVATDAEPEAVMALFPRAIGTGLQHGTVTVVVDGLPVEVTTYRVEVGYSDGRRPDEVRFTRELEADLSRRDFTVNAMAWDPARGEIRDPFGGQHDLARRVLRAVGEAEARFGEDGLRAMRAVRFATVLDLALDPATEAAIPKTLPTFRRIAVERIQVELAKLLRAPRAGWGVRALARTALLPEILPAVAALSPERLERTAVAVGAAPDGLEVRLAALLWGTDDDGAACEALRFSRATCRAVQHLLGLRSLSPRATDPAPALRAAVAQVGREAWPDFLAVRRAWADGADVATWDALGARVDALAVVEGPLAVRELAIDGRAVVAALGIAPSRRVGRLLQALLEATWADPALNTADGLLAALPAIDAGLEDGP